LAFGEPQQIGSHAHLAIALIAGADADHRDAELLAETCRQLGRHMLDHQRKTAGGLQIPGLAAQPFLAEGVVGLTPVAQLMHGLRCEPQVPHHRDAAAHQPIHHRDGFRLSALQLHGGGGAVFEHTPCGGHGGIAAALVAEEGQIGDDQRLLRRRLLQPPPNGAGVQDHFFQRDRKGGGMAKHHHRQGIPNQDHVGAGLLHQRGREGIPGGEGGDGPPFLLAGEQISRSHAGALMAEAHC